ncbi:MAG: nucleotide exchange factor GrpE [Candidatus Beckwithbacteria bacterium]|nr:nucleotide exchange factor GrpE [Patescibacteria group bacterium]
MKKSPSKDQLKRALADYQNLKRRIEKDKYNYAKFATSSIIDKLLSVLDDLERADQHLKDQGLKLAINQFKSILDLEGVKEIKVLNKEFDPQTSDCVELIKGEKNKIIEIIKKGYTIHEKVLRPAQVKVGQGGK